MKSITDQTRVGHIAKLVGEMMSAQEGDETEFDLAWIRSHDWIVVPVKSAARLPIGDIPRLVSTLRNHGQAECLAVYNELGYIQRLPVIVASDPPGDLSTCYSLAIEESEFVEFNRQLGPFRSILTTEARSWAISCNEWYNLFGAEPMMIEELIGRKITQARQEFIEFASLFEDGDSENRLLQIANRYANR